METGLECTLYIHCSPNKVDNYGVQCLYGQYAGWLSLCSKGRMNIMNGHLKTIQKL